MFFRTFASEMMTKDEIISNLMEQLKATNEQNAALINRVAELTAQLKEALARLESIEQSVKQKDETIRKEKNKNKGLTTLLEKDSEQQKPPKPELTDDEKKVLEEARAIRRKQRGNNGARRDSHTEVKVEYHDVYPDDPDFDMEKARPLEVVPSTASACATPTHRATSPSTSTACTPSRRTAGCLSRRLRRRHSSTPITTPPSWQG